jgi:hypothetical protein
MEFVRPGLRASGVEFTPETTPSKSTEKATEDNTHQCIVERID